MKKSKELMSLLSLLKVFDVNFANDEDCMKIQGLDVNNSADVIKAVNTLLLPEYSIYSQDAQDRLLESLRKYTSNPDEDFELLFEEIALVFDDEVIDKRAFMSALLVGIESFKSTQ